MLYKEYGMRGNLSYANTIVVMLRAMNSRYETKSPEVPQSKNSYVFEAHFSNHLQSRKCVRQHLLLYTMNRCKHHVWIHLCIRSYSYRLHI